VTRLRCDGSISRRGLLTGLVSLIAAPAIVRAESIMPVKVWKPEPWPPGALGEYRGFNWIETMIDVANSASGLLPTDTLNVMRSELMGIPVMVGPETDEPYIVLRRAGAAFNDFRKFFYLQDPGAALDHEHRG